MSVFHICGIAVCPLDAPLYIRETADFITEKIGGEGVLREVLDKLIQDKNWEREMINYYKNL